MRKYEENQSKVVLSCFSYVQLCVTTWTVGCQALCPWDSPGKNTEVGCHALLQGIFLTQVKNPCLLHLLHWQMGSLPLVPLRKPNKKISIAKGDFVNRPIFKIKSGSVQQSPLNFYKIIDVNLQILKLIGQNKTEEPFLT